MTPPDFSVLLLAWNEAYPGVAVLGGAALPPTLSLVYRLAPEQPVLAVFPHLPAEEKAPPAGSAGEHPTEPAPAAEPGAAQAQAAPESSPASLPAPMPGVRLLSGSPADEEFISTPSAPAQPSRLVGLSDLTLASATHLHTALGPPVASQQDRRLAASRSQWPTGIGARQPGAWQAPAAPYLGAGPDDLTPPLLAPASPVLPAPTVREAADLSVALIPAGAAPAHTLRPAAYPQAGDLHFDPDPELPAVRHPAPFDEPTAEIGPAEANALAEPEDNITPDEAPATPALAAVAAAPVLSANKPAATAALGPVVLTPSLEGLNFRMIQYARQTAQLVRNHAGFGVIYAPSWPAWLAALEIRNRTGCPLVLYAAGLAADFTSPAERGWLLEVERMTLRRAHLVLVPNEDVRQRLQAQYGATTGEIRVVAADDEDEIRRVLREKAQKLPPPPLAAV